MNTITTNKTAVALSKTLAEEYVLLLKTQNFHWNVDGPLFFSLHKLFESQYKELLEYIDDTAEVIRTFNVKTPGSFREFQKIALIDEAPNDMLTAHQMIEILNKDHMAMSTRLKEHLEEAEQSEDTSAVTLYEDLITFHDKAAWMIRSHRA
ncbi:Dps family protein [Bdellovibrio sp. NC01]|uniref:Dps family protein n=1 Tax=Bdellovibrio sp. NC01 TaxID=2220073 RepID=UPI00115733AC|nr:DNA starvation/stationary phase protection protein [Bdellovibrio sp. NC01]QDK36337.1 DNA starvation/stationary phase protection protein [Bdellovibrio sp. NC01]